MITPRGRPTMPEAAHDPLIDDPLDDGPTGRSTYVRRLTGLALLDVTEKTINRYREVGEDGTPLLTTYRDRARPFEVWLARAELLRLRRALDTPAVVAAPAQERAARLRARVEQLAVLELAHEHQNL